MNYERIMENLENSPDVREVLLPVAEDILLEENEHLLQIDSRGVGFMVKKNKDNTIPKAFKDWGCGKYFIIMETFRNGWSFNDIRTGKSTTWMKLTHPFGFKVEYNMLNFRSFLKEVTIEKSKIHEPCYFEGRIKCSKFKWVKS